MPSQSTRPCIDCGKPCTRRVRGGRAWLCVRCAQIRTAQANLEMMRKEGPAWERWQTAMRKAAAKHAS